MLKRVCRVREFVYDKSLVLFLAAVALLAEARMAMAQSGGIGDLGANITANVPGVAKAIQVVAFLIGFLFVVMGIIDFAYTGKKPDATVGGGIKKVAIGALLIGIGAVITASSASIFGSDESGAGMGEIGL